MPVDGFFFAIFNPQSFSSTPSLFCSRVEGSFDPSSLWLIHSRSFALRAEISGVVSSFLVFFCPCFDVEGFFFLFSLSLLFFRPLSLACCPYLTCWFDVDGGTEVC